MVPIARRNLFHDKIRLAVAVVGLAITVVLVLHNVGTLNFAMSTAGVYIDHVDADIWVAQRGSDCLPKRSSIRKTVAGMRSIKGVTEVTPLLIADVGAKTVTGLPDSEERKFSVTLVGYDTDTGRGGPWELTPGALSSAPGNRDIILDRRVAEKNGIGVGDVIRANSIALNVIALSENTSTMSEQMGFVPLRTAQEAAQTDNVSYLLVKTDTPAVQGVSQTRRGPVWNCPICDEIERRSDLEVFSKEQFYENSINIWMEWMGIWMMAGTTVILGVGAVVVMLTTYTATVEKLPEFGILKAIGTSNWHVARIVLTQALISATGGYALGFALTLGFVGLIARFVPDTDVSLTPALGIGVYIMVLALASLSALLAIYKAVRVDPMIVFRSRH
jgi:putative ABC transport system permease protein